MTWWFCGRSCKSVRIYPSLSLPAMQSLWTEQAFTASLEKPNFCHCQWQSTWKRSRHGRQSLVGSPRHFAKPKPPPWVYPVEERETAIYASKEIEELRSRSGSKWRNISYMTYVILWHKFENWIQGAHQVPNIHLAAHSAKPSKLRHHWKDDHSYCNIAQ